MLLLLAALPLRAILAYNQVPGKTSRLTLSEVEGLIASVPPAIRSLSPPYRRHSFLTATKIRLLRVGTSAIR
jgi:hypothetical protein